MFQTLLTGIWVVLITLILYPEAVLVTLFQKNGRLAHLLGRVWAKSILFVSRVKVRVIGLENLDKNGSFIYMANHQSMFDILVLYAYLPVQFRWLAKIELFRIPLFGHAMSRIGCIGIDRSDGKAAYRSLMAAAQRVNNGISVLVFPEGTRSHDGEIKPFKKGGFLLALKSKRPIVPIVIHGTHEIMRRGRIRVKPGRVVMKINQPIQTESYNKSTQKILMDRVMRVMCDSLERIKNTG
nr:1-acyl-sn-glycerol-3-phosphate acyltransferase [Desulfobacterales bacterium]